MNTLTSPKLIKYYLVILFLITSALTFAFIQNVSQTITLKNNSKIVSAEVQKGYARIKDHNRTKIEYSFYVDGKRYEGKSAGASNKKAELVSMITYPEAYRSITHGQIIDIAYHEKDPTLNRPTIILNYHQAIEKGLLLLLCLAAFIFILKKYNKKDTP